MRFSRIYLLGLLALSCVLEGCAGNGGGSDVSGSVLLDGQPLAGAEVRFVSQDDSNPGMHTTTTDSAGKFTLVPDSNIPIKPGAYVILVSKLAVKEGGAKQAEGKGTMVNTVPSDYQNRGKTPLHVDIKPGANQLPPFELTSKPKKR